MTRSGFGSIIHYVVNPIYSKKVKITGITFLSILFLALVFPNRLEGTKYAGEPFSLGFGARALAMGASFTAIGEDASTVFWNPGGLTYLTGMNFLFMHGSYFSGAETQEFLAGSFQNALSYRTPLGFSLYFLSSPGIKSTEISGDTIPNEGNLTVTDTLNYKAYRVTLSSAKKLWGGSLGATLKFLGEDLGVENGWGIGIDIGYLFKRGPIGIGFVAKDLSTTPIFWSSGTHETISPSIRTGLAYHHKKAFLLTFDWLFLTENRKAEAAYELGPISVEPHFGGEVKITKVIALRGGFDNGDLTFGAGAKFKGWQLDYALLSHPELGSSHRISLALHF